MNKKNSAFKPGSHLESQSIAITGLKMILRNERNFRIQLTVAAFVYLTAWALNFSHRDWVSISLLIGMVLISEAFNSVVEALCDTISQEYKVNIQYAKDVSAGAVLLSAIVAVVAGSIIVTPYILDLVTRYVG